VKRTQTYTIDGKTYDSLEAMPPDVRRRVEALSSMTAALRAKAAANPSKRTEFRFEERVEYGPGDLKAGRVPPELASLGTPSASLGAGTKVVGQGLLLLLFVVMFLAFWGFSSRVRITVAYGPMWWAAACVLALALTVGLFCFGRKVAARDTARSNPFRPSMLLALAIGMSVFSAEAVFGGIPVLAHHLSAHPGELLVTVQAKESNGRRYACAPRLVIAQFTYRMHNYLCPGARAFREIQVGSTIRLEGAVSDFGVDFDVFTWATPR
jgi:hypothetical protein